MPNNIVEAGAGPLIWNQAALQSLIGIDGSTLPQVLTLQPAGHAPGAYLITPYGRVRTVGASGQITLTLGWTDPQSGAATFALGGFNVATLGLFAIAARGIISNGVGAITITATVSVAIVGAPVVDAYGNAALVGS